MTVRAESEKAVVLDDLVGLLGEAAEECGALLERARGALRARLAGDDDEGRIDSARLEAEQHRVHGLAWLATYVEAIRQLAAYASRLDEAGRFGELEALLSQVAVGAYAAHIAGGIPMSQAEMVRLEDLGLDDDA